MRIEHLRSKSDHVVFAVIFVVALCCLVVATISGVSPSYADEIALPPALTLDETSHAATPDAGADQDISEGYECTTAYPTVGDECVIVTDTAEAPSDSAKSEATRGEPLRWSSNVGAEFTSSDGLWGYTYYGSYDASGNQIEVLVVQSYLGSATSIIVPDTIDGKEVYGVTSYSKQPPAAWPVTDITFSAGIKCICARAFLQCSSLQSVTFAPGSQCSVIAEYAFAATGLTSFTMPDALRRIEFGAFEDCLNLTDLYFNDNLYPFERSVNTYGCLTPYFNPGMTSPVIVYHVPATSKNFKVIDGSLYSKDGTVLYSRPLHLQSASFVIPEGVTDVAAYALHYHQSMTSLTLPSTLLLIGERAFDQSGLTSLAIPSSVIGIDVNAFIFCTSLTTITGGAGLEAICSRAFARTGISSFPWGDNVVFVSGLAFSNCANFSNPDYPSYLTQTSSGDWINMAAYYDDHYLLTGTIDYNKAREVLTIVNDERASQGLSALALDEELTEAAMQRAAECSLYFDHTRPNGTDCSAVSDKVYGENIAAGQRTAAAVMTSWMGSSGHRANILNSDYQSIGIGCFRFGGVYYWVQLFGYDAASGTVSSGTPTASYDTYVSYSTITFDGSFNKNMYMSDPMSLDPGSTFELSADVSNSGVPGMYMEIDPAGLTWASSDSSVATVNNGVVTGVAAGTATITAMTPGGKVFTQTFKVGFDLSKGSVSVASPVRYDDTAQTPAVTVTFKGRTLTKGSDYTVAYSNNVEVGTATATITGIGQYEGTLTTTFYIDHVDVSNLTDLEAGAWYLTAQAGLGAFYDNSTLYLDYAFAHGLMKGYTDSQTGQVTRFGPNDNLTRAQAAIVIYRMVTGDNNDGAESNAHPELADVEDGAWYTKAVNWAVDNGIITGYADPVTKIPYAFGPNDLVTREQIATMIARLCVGGKDNLAGYSTASAQGYSDAGAISDWALPGVAYCNDRRIMTGIGGTNTFGAEESLTRAAMVKVASVTHRNVLGGRD